MKCLAIGAGLMALAAGLGAAPGGGAGAGAAPSGLVINVMSLKAVADGTTDCSAAIESAFRAELVAL